MLNRNCSTDIDKSYFSSDNQIQTEYLMEHKEIETINDRIDKGMMCRPFMQNRQIQISIKTMENSINTLIETQDSYLQTKLKD